MRPRLHGHAHAHAQLHGIARVRRLVEHRRQIVVAADGDVVHLPAVDRDLELARILQPANDVQVRAIQLRAELVLGVERERVTNLKTTDRSERKPFDVLVLRQILRNAIGVAAWPHRAVANGEPADFAGCCEISLLQRRRHAEHVGDVVEAVRRIVRRQQCRHIDIERQQIPDRVLVLRSIESMEQRAAWIRPRLCSLVETRLERRDQRVHRRVIGPTRALRRHDAGPQLADDLFPQIDVVRDVGDVRVLEHQIARLEARAMAGDAVLVDRGLRAGIRDSDVGIREFGIRDSRLGMRARSWPERSAPRARQ